MSNRFFLTFSMVALLLVQFGCGGVHEVPGGTSGRVMTGGDPVPDLRLVFYQADNQQADPVGFAISDPQGRFEIRKEGTLEGVWLEAGEYRVTIESAGENMMVWPKQYRDPVQSPLKLTVTGEVMDLQIDVPFPRVVR